MAYSTPVKREMKSNSLSHNQNTEKSNRVGRFQSPFDKIIEIR